MPLIYEAICFYETLACVSNVRMSKIVCLRKRAPCKNEGGQKKKHGTYLHGSANFSESGLKFYVVSCLHSMTNS